MLQVLLSVLSHCIDALVREYGVRLMMSFFGSVKIAETEHYVRSGFLEERTQENL